MDDRTQKFINRCEAKGEKQVREDLAVGRYGGVHIGLATVWLEERDREASISASNEANALTRAQTSAQRSAADSSRTLADEAKEANRLALDANVKANTANTIATIALIAAIIAIALSIIGLFLS